MWDSGHCHYHRSFAFSFIVMITLSAFLFWGDCVAVLYPQGNQFSRGGGFAYAYAACEYQWDLDTAAFHCRYMNICLLIFMLSHFQMANDQWNTLLLVYNSVVTCFARHLWRGLALDISQLWLVDFITEWPAWLSTGPWHYEFINQENESERMDLM